MESPAITESTIDWNNLDQHLNQCHGALMRVWNKYHPDLVRKGFDTATEAVNEVALRCLQNKEKFVGTTVSYFCSWSRTILLHWILNELYRRRPDQISESYDPTALGQPRPSVDYENKLLHFTIEVARDQLTNVERALFDALSDHPPKEGVIRPKPLPPRVRDYLDTHCPGLRQLHPEWEDNGTLAAACDAAWTKFDSYARAFHDELEGVRRDGTAPS